MIPKVAVALITGVSLSIGDDRPGEAEGVFLHAEPLSAPASATAFLVPLTIRNRNTQ